MSTLVTVHEFDTARLAAETASCTAMSCTICGKQRKIPTQRWGDVDGSPACWTCTRRAAA